MSIPTEPDDFAESAALPPRNPDSILLSIERRIKLLEARVEGLAIACARAVESLKKGGADA